MYHAALHVHFQVCGAVTTNPHSTHVRIIYAESEAAFDAAYVAPRRDGLKEVATLSGDSSVRYG